MARDDLIGTTDAAIRCGVDRTTFFRWVQLGKIAYEVKMPGDTGAMLFTLEAVDRLIAERNRALAEDGAA